MRTQQLSEAQAAYLSHFIDGPAYVWPYGTHGNIVRAAQRAGYVTVDEHHQASLTEAGRSALSHRHTN